MKQFAWIICHAVSLRRLILVSSLALAAGCDDAKDAAEFFGIIGGEDGPTAVWLTTRLPWSDDEPIVRRGTKGTTNCVFDDNGVAVPNISDRNVRVGNWSLPIGFSTTRSGGLTPNPKFSKP